MITASQLDFFGSLVDGRQYAVRKADGDVHFYVCDWSEGAVHHHWEDIDMWDLPHEALLELAYMVGASPTAAEVRRAREIVEEREQDHPFNHPPFPFVLKQLEDGTWTAYVPLEAADQDEATAKAWGLLRVLQRKPTEIDGSEKHD